MTGHPSARLLRRGLLLAAVAVLAAFGVSSLASATGSHQAAHSPIVKTVTIRGNNRPHFVGPDSIQHGDKLRIINKTNPKKIGPHTFSLVKASVLPKTPHQQKVCFHRHHICREIAHWHGFPPRITRNPVRVGHKGWDKAGDLNSKGDSYFAGRQGARFKQRVSAHGGVVLHFMCAVHPFMHKRIVVH